MPVEQGARPELPKLQRRLLAGARALTTPLLPDDYIALINPLWSSRELQGTIVELRHETPRSTTVVIRPSFRWPGHVAGQYIRIGVKHDGVRHWRAYTLTSDHPHPRGLISVSVRKVDGGRVSSYLNGEARPGSTVFLGEVEGTFTLPDPVPTKLLAITAGSGITPIFAILRELASRGAGTDVVHIHSERTPEEMMFADHFGPIGERVPGYRRFEQITSRDGRLIPTDLDKICPDWKERETFLTGPPELLDAFTEHFKACDVYDRLEVEHFQPFVPNGGDGGLGEGGVVRFKNRDNTVEAGPDISILAAGEEAGAKLAFGCRMGICHTCNCKLISGQVRDLRTGEVHGEPGDSIRICISAAEGDVELEEGRVVMDGTQARSKS